MLEKEPQFIRPNSDYGKNKAEVPQIQPEQKEAKKDRIQELRDNMKEIWEELRKEGVPIDERARINMDEFRKIHGKESIEHDKERVKHLKKVFKEADRGKDSLYWASSKEETAKKVSMGEAFEMLTTSIFHKKLGKEFIVVRTSEYDDFENNVDNIILERETGNIVCAFDEVEFGNKQTRQDKKDKVSDRNKIKGGADLKYGIFLEKEEKAMKLKKGRIDQIPLFYLAESEEDVKKALDNPDQRAKVFYEFIGLIKEQIEDLKGEALGHKLKERLDHFEQVIDKF